MKDGDILDFQKGGNLRKGGVDVEKGVQPPLPTMLMKQKANNIKIIYYYSDGAPSQHKNYKGLVNLCHHRLDHGIDAVWNFFATSHGKSAFDGIGGTVKRLATNASLMATEKNHILTPLDLLDWTSKNICNNDFIYISAEEITEHYQKNNLN